MKVFTVLNKCLYLHCQSQTKIHKQTKRKDKKMRKFAIANKNGERMYQFPVFYYLELAEQVCRRQRSIRPEAGFHVIQIEGGAQ